MGAGSPCGRPPPPPWRCTGFPERSGLEPLVRCRRCGQPGVANRRARDPLFPRAAGRESQCGERRGSALAAAGVRAPGLSGRRRVPRASGSLSSCSDCVSVSCLCSWGGGEGGGRNTILGWVPSGGGTGAFSGPRLFPVTA